MVCGFPWVARPCALEQELPASCKINGSVVVGGVGVRMWRGWMLRVSRIVGAATRLKPCPDTNLRAGVSVKLQTSSSVKLPASPLEKEILLATSVRHQPQLQPGSRDIVLRDVGCAAGDSSPSGREGGEIQFPPCRSAQCGGLRPFL